jgi:hypothetical protein
MATKKKPVRKPTRSAKSAPKKSTRAPRKTPAPKYLHIGERSAAEGGVFMGIARGEKGQPDCYLYRGRYADKAMTHTDALKFAATCRDGKHSDWELPNRTTGALLYANGREDMRSGWRVSKQKRVRCCGALSLHHPTLRRARGAAAGGGQVGGFMPSFSRIVRN